MPPPRKIAPDDARALLGWYAEAGVDEAVADEPHDRFMAPAPAQAASAETTAPPRPAAAMPDDMAGAARQLAGRARSLDELHNLVAAFEGCPLRYSAKNMCFADGNPQARIMFVGEAPGADEDLEGLPFVGRAGKLLDLMLAAIGLDRTNAYIANVVYWRPPGNRTPTPQETQACRPFIERQIALADPDILVLLGGTAAKELLNRQEGIMRLRGRWHDYDTGTRKIPAMPTLHPSYLLRQPGQKRLAWRDFLAIARRLAELPPREEAQGGYRTPAR